MTEALGVKAILKTPAGILILRKPIGEYDLPGGRVLSCEPLRAALAREVNEETGLAIQVLAPLFSWEFIKPSGLHVKGLTFYCYSLDVNVVLSKEHDALLWLNPTTSWEDNIKRFLPADRNYLGRVFDSKTPEIIME